MWMRCLFSKHTFEYLCFSTLELIYWCFELVVMNFNDFMEDVVRSHDNSNWIDPLLMYFTFTSIFNTLKTLKLKRTT